MHMPRLLRLDRLACSARFALLLPLAGIALLAFSSDAHAQRSAPVTDTMFLRAQRLANDGDAEAGRRLVDSLFRAAPAGSARQAEALYWRAALAATAAEAERDYRRLTVEYPLSPRSEDALITLAQLEMTRREYPQALRHLERLVQEYPASGSIPRAHFWIGRVHLEQGNLPRACASLASARSTASPTNVELHNQIDFHSQRCLGVNAATETVAAAPSPQPPPPTPPSATPVTGPPSGAGSSNTTPPSRDTATPRPSPASGTTSASPPSSASPASGATQYTVQVAALNTRAQADELRDKLRERGLDARVVGTGQLFRVRIGRYPTREAAAAVAADLKQRGISRDAWVAEAEAR